MQGDSVRPMTDCIFCKIASGEVPSTIRNESDNFVAFEDLAPVADTHLLVIPRQHHTDFDAWVAAGGHSTELLEFVAATASKAGVAGRYRLITNVGSDAGQAVFHFHWHIIAGTNIPGF